MITILNKQHTYKCNHSTTDKITWRVNNKVLGVEIENITGIKHTDRFSHPGDTIYILTIKALPQHNGTSIQCTAAFSGGSQLSAIVTFLIQGQLITPYTSNYSILSQSHL